MRPTEILSGEHRVIEQVLTCLERVADRAETDALDCASGRDVVEFLQGFADRCHHGKEEARLFPAMERCGLPADAGPTAVMRAEHDTGRRAVRAMAAAVADAERGDAAAAGRFVREARAFVDLLRDHIAKEDQVLFPMADRMLAPSVQEDLLRGFAHAEEHEMGEGTHERFLALAESLAARWGVTPEATRAAAHTCACSHATQAPSAASPRPTARAPFARTSG
jgi:hemerythrin-like domain-containing protein